MKFTVPYGGERLDRIAKAILGTELDGAVEEILDINPGLAKLIYPTGDVPAGTEITIPDDWAPPPDESIVLQWE